MVSQIIMAYLFVVTWFIPISLDITFVASIVCNMNRTSVELEFRGLGTQYTPANPLI